MKKFLLPGILLCTFITLSGQTIADTISIERKQVARFYFQGKLVKPAQLLALTKTDKAAYREMFKAKGKRDAAGIFGFVGGVILGWQFMSTIQGQPAPWEFTAVGVGCLIASIPFSSSYSKHAVKAVELYNDGIKNNNLGYDKLELEMGIVGNGLGLRLGF